MADQRSLLFLSKLYHLDNNRDGCVLHWSAARFLFLHSSDSLIPKVCIATILLFACNSCSDKRPSGLSVRTFSENFKKDLTTSLFLFKTPLFTRVSESEVLSDLFAKHLPHEKPCKQRGSGRKSEVVRCFFENYEKLVGGF